MKLLGILAGVLLYLEIVYHVGCFGFTAGSPVFALTLVLVVASLGALIIGCVSGKGKKTVLWIMLGLAYLLYGIQLVYMGIFKQPLQWEAMIRGGQDALTNYWREALAGVMSALPILALMLVPLVGVGILLRRKPQILPTPDNIGKLRLMLCTGVSIILAVMVMMIGKYIDADYYTDYMEFYDPYTVVEDMGVLVMAQRDSAGNLAKLGKWAGEALADMTGKADMTETVGTEQSAPKQTDSSADNTEETMESHESVNSSEEVGTETAENSEDAENTGESEEHIEELPDTSPNQLPIDLTVLQSNADGKETTWLSDYLGNVTPTNRNAYTGIFEDHNLIFLTAEGFSPYAVREDLTPTLYRLIHSGFDFTNYYVPLWQTSTSDGEYVNCTGLIPDGQFSMRKSGSNNMSFTLPGYFASQGVSSFAYHNNNLSYYDRHVTHNNLGYVYKAAKLGDLSQEEWGQYIFPMENPDKWPASDLEMIQGTVSEYIDRDRFHVYYLTVSGHMNYSFIGNSMASKNREAVAGLEMSETARAYIACQIELDKALEYLLGELEAAGKLENTVICLSADHYPYGMEQAVYEELAGKALSENMDMYRNNLILWNEKLEENPKVIDKVCCSVDILPTLLNLFGFSYDSRLYAGRDIFSEEEGMVIFNDRSFITDHVIYHRKANQTLWKNAEEWDESIRAQYLEQMQQEVKDRYQFSAYVLRNDYYQLIQEALPEEHRNDQTNPAKNAP